MSAVIEANELTRSFGQIRAVDGVSFSVARGEVFGLLGPNGAGKSTLLRMLTTLLTPTSGNASILGHDVVRDAAQVRPNIGVVLQEVGLDDRQTGYEVLTLHGLLYGLRPRDARARATEMLEIVGLADAANRRVGAYSGGMRRRIDLAMALLHEPPVMFLDEPTTGLDPSSRAAIWDLLARRCAESGTTIFLTTQYLEEADRIADRVAFADRGRIVREGTPSELKAELATDTVEITTALPEQAAAVLASVPGIRQVLAQPGGVTVRIQEASVHLAPIVAALLAADLEPKEIVVTQPTLDDVFRVITTVDEPAGRGGGER
ncbi:ATP-binding cassette domain-containing protein [Pseudonocardia zijingensis]|uniref:ATP-binding cassette domain-containing protein n=2 Tax=Pseudonocardia zijingensis TaxID=153376 RepID=A0ABP3YMT8_9PSEU